MCQLARKNKERVKKGEEEMKRGGGERRQGSDHKKCKDGSLFQRCRGDAAKHGVVLFGLSPDRKSVV